jgi:hypothetical protein
LRVKDVATLTSLTDSAGVAFFADLEQVAKFESAIGDENRFMALEQVLGDDFPEITLSSDTQARFELARTWLLPSRDLGAAPRRAKRKLGYSVTDLVV